MNRGDSYAIVAIQHLVSFSELQTLKRLRAIITYRHLKISSYGPSAIML